MKKFINISLTTVLAVVMTLSLTGLAKAASPATVNLGAAGSFAVLAYSAVTNTGNSVITGNLGLTPTAGSGITGFYVPGVVNGTIYTVNGAGPTGYVEDPARLTSAKSSQTAAYLDAAGRTPPTVIAGSDNQLGGQTLTPGVYSFSAADTANLIGTLTLDDNGESDPIWIFQTPSTLVTASDSDVVFLGAGDSCDVFWQVGSSATLGTTTNFVGNIMALASVTMNTGATLIGSAHALNGAVTLDTNTVTKAVCGTDTAYTATATSTATTATSLPATGDNTSNNNIIWYIAIPVAIIAVLALYFVTRRKKDTSQV